ncbi:MAG: glycoside hydrolase family 2 protein [Candidatus Avoscillospira sp.]
MKSTKRLLSLFLAAYMVWSLLPVTASAARGTEGRQTVSLNGSWTFTGHDGTQTAVQVPHSWEYMDPNAFSPAGSSRTCAYERTVEVGPFAGKQLFLQFGAVNKEAVIYVNGQEVGRHDGGFTAFSVDITEACRGKETVTVKVEVTNITGGTMPINTDFTHFAGIYRDVRLVAVDPRAYLSLEDSGSQGVYLDTAVDLTTGMAVLTPRVLLSSQEPGGKITVTVTLKDAAGCTVGTACKAVTGAGLLEEVTLDPIVVSNAHLWQGTRDPYLYTAETQVCVDGKPVDFNSQRIGFRTYKVQDGTFYLNGQPYALRGVGMHQEFGAVTNVTTQAQKEQDLQMILEMGANALRTCHYPHDQAVYDLCDELGIVVWSEIPFYLLMLDTDAFRQNVMQAAEEMVKQGYNHPSIFVWGIENEVNYYGSYEAYYDQPDAAALGAFMQELAQMVKELDPSRMVGEAVMDGASYVRETAGWTTDGSGIDTVGLNMYTGWYSNVNGATPENLFDRIVMSFQSKLQSYQSVFNQSSRHTVSYVLTEYGAGANIGQHADLGAGFRWGGADSTKGYATSGDFHPEEYQSYVHEGMLMAIYGDETNEVPPAEDLWCAFAWAMFDFSTYRNEGGMPRMNTKGLVTADRSVKKDAFYLYKANWNDTDPFVHITSSRYAFRPSRTIDVKVYSNLESVELTVNGAFYGAGEKQQDGVFVWKDVELNDYGQPNTVLASGVKDGRVYTDVCETWTVGDAAEITVHNTLDKSYDGLPVQDPDYTVTLRNGAVDITEDAAVTAAWYQLTEGDGTAYPGYGEYPSYNEYPAYNEYPSYNEYPAYGQSWKRLPLENAPTDPGLYCLVLTVADGSNGAYTWLGSSLEIPFAITE